MPCNCGNKSASGQPKSYTVRFSDGSTKSYRTEIEAKAAAARSSGATVRPGS